MITVFLYLTGAWPLPFSGKKGCTEDNTYEIKKSPENISFSAVYVSKSFKITGLLRDKIVFTCQGDNHLCFTYIYIPHIHEFFAIFENTSILWNLRKNWSLKIKMRKFKDTKLSIFGANLVSSAWYNGLQENQRKITVV